MVLRRISDAQRNTEWLLLLLLQRRLTFFPSAAPAATFSSAAAAAAARPRRHEHWLQPHCLLLMLLTLTLLHATLQLMRQPLLPASSSVTQPQGCTLKRREVHAVGCGPG